MLSAWGNICGDRPVKGSHDNRSWKERQSQVSLLIGNAEGRTSRKIPRHEQTRYSMEPTTDQLFLQLCVAALHAS